MQYVRAGVGAKLPRLSGGWDACVQKGHGRTGLLPGDMTFLRPGVARRAVAPFNGNGQMPEATDPPSPFTGPGPTVRPHTRSA